MLNTDDMDMDFWSQLIWHESNCPIRIQNKQIKSMKQILDNALQVSGLTKDDMAKALTPYANWVQQVQNTK